MLYQLSYGTFRFASAKVVRFSDSAKLFVIFFSFFCIFPLFGDKKRIYEVVFGEKGGEKENIWLFIIHIPQIICTFATAKRKVAQLVAHYVRDVGVGRSSRLFPTA